LKPPFRTALKQTLKAGLPIAAVPHNYEIRYINNSG